MPRIRDRLPAPIRDPIAGARRRVLLQLGTRQLRQRGPSRTAIRNLSIGWGNPNFSAGDAYVLAALEYGKKSQGSILECGSGLTTLALGLSSAVTVPVWSLEHHPDWAKRTRHTLEILRAKGPQVLDVPLRRYGGIEWYEVPPELPDQFDLVICDGPPGTTPGGRWGLWEVLGDRLHTATVILDDAHRPSEASIVQRLRADGWGAEIHREGRRSFAILTQPSASGS